MVAPWKIQVVEEIKKLLEEYPVIGIADAMDLPTAQFQRIRKELKKRGVIIKVVKKTLLKRALDQVKDKKKGIEEIEKYIEKGKRVTPTLIFAKDINAFKLFKLIEENKSPAPAKPGVIAPKDIVIPAGPTPFTPGPMIGFLSRMGLKVKVEGGRIVIQEDKVIVRAGEVIKPEVADLLNKLGIEPLEVKLKVLGIWEAGIFYPADVLAIDEKEYKENVIKAFRTAVELGIRIGFPARDILPVAIQRAYKIALELSAIAGIPSKSNIEYLLKKAQSIALTLAFRLPEDLRPEEVKVVTEAPKEAKEEEKPKEEEKKEEKAEEETLGGLAALFGT